MVFRLVFLVGIVLFKPMASFGQDTIYRMNGDTVFAKVIGVNAEDVKYKKDGNISGPTYTILRSTVKSISYKNGTTISIDGKQGEAIATVPDTSSLVILPVQEQPDLVLPDTSATTLVDESYSLNGRDDAKAYYKKYKMAAALTLTISLLSPLVGLVPAFTCSVKSPAETNLGYPDDKMAKNQTYTKAYAKEANKIKQTKVWTGWAIGLAVNYGLSILLFGN